MVSLLMLAIPFIFITNLFPFMRFGMFAEKPSISQGIELFEVRFLNQNKAISQEQLAIPPHMLSSLIRTYYYKGEIDKCANNIYQLAGNNHTITIYKLTTKEKINSTELIYIYPNE